MTFHRGAKLAAVLAAGLMVMGQGAALAKDRAACEREFTPEVGQDGKDVIWVPTDDALVRRMLQMAKTTPADYVIDLGAGDGKIVIAAARDFGARGLGIEYNPQMVQLANCYAQAEGVADKVKIVQGDIFKESFSNATVLTLYLLTELNLKLRPTILEMRPGTRVASHSFMMGDWEPDDQVEEGFSSAYLWIVPAKVQGTWRFAQQGGADSFTVQLTQQYQKIGGTVRIDGQQRPLIEASLRGADIKLIFTDDTGAVREVAGTVEGGKILATARGPRGSIGYTGTRQDT